MSTSMFDVIIVGGGPAGLSAALTLGRCRRQILVCDDGKPRNIASQALHGYLTRDGMSPADFLALGREEILRYDVNFRHGRVETAIRHDRGFEVVMDDGVKFVSRKLLLTTGMVDELPEIDGLLEMYGKSVHHCPYCDGWEVSGKAVALYGCGQSGASLAATLTVWTPDVVLCLDGGVPPGETDRARLKRLGLSVRHERIVRLEGHGGQLERIVFESGPPLEREALFFTTGQRQCSPLAERLGCRMGPKGTVVTDRSERTGVPGLYLAGDASIDTQFIVVAASEGAKAAIALNQELHHEDCP